MQGSWNVNFIPLHNAANLNSFVKIYIKGQSQVHGGIHLDCISDLSLIPNNGNHKWSPEDCQE